jgi:RNA polymerase sigma-70 factor (ECF subfamily)
VRPELAHVLGFAQRLGCSGPEAEDALQDALACLAAVRDSTPTVVGLRVWLCRKVHTHARSHLRSERRRHIRESIAAVPAVQERPSDPVALRDEVESALAGLAEQLRVAVELRFLHDLDYREMAHVLRVPEGTCRQRVSRALAELRTRFGLGAGALVAALPLPRVEPAMTLVKGALAKSAFTSTATGWGILAMSAKKTAVVGLAIAVGVVGTLGVQAVLPGGDGSAPTRGGRSTATLEPANRDREIARLRKQLAVARAAKPPKGLPSKRPEGQDSAPRDGATAAVSDYVALGALWRAAIFQLDDPKKRDNAWTEVREALSGEDLTALRAALWTVRFTSHVAGLNRSGLRSQLDPFLDASDAETRLLAWQALISIERVARVTGTGPGVDPAMIDKLREQTAESPPKTRAGMLSSLIGVSGYEVNGPTAEVVLHLLEDADSRSETWRGLGCAKKLSDPVAAEVLECARSSPKDAEQVNRMILANLDEKSRDVVIYLLDSAEAGVPGALRALRHGVRPEDAPLVGDRLRRLFEARLDPLLRGQIVTTIGYAGDTSARAWLTGLRDDEDLHSGLRYSALVALRQLDTLASGARRRR